MKFRREVRKVNKHRTKSGVLLSSSEIHCVCENLKHKFQMFGSASQSWCTLRSPAFIAAKFVLKKQCWVQLRGEVTGVADTYQV